MKGRKATTKEIEICAQKLSSYHFTRLMMLSDVVSRYVSIALKNEVNWLKMGVLINLLLTEEAITSNELAKNILRPKQNVTALLDSFERDGLVVRERGKANRRFVQIAITKKGVEYVLESLMKISLIEKELNYCLNGSELKAISSMVKKIRRHMVSLVTDDPDYIKNRLVNK